MIIEDEYYDGYRGVVVKTVTHEPPLSTPAKVDIEGSVKTSQLGEDANTFDVLTFLLLMCEQDSENINDPKLWMESSKVLDCIFNGSMDTLYPPEKSAEDLKKAEDRAKGAKHEEIDYRGIDVKKFQELIKKNPRLLGGAGNAVQNLKMKVWARVYYQSIKKDGHRTSRGAIAIKIRDKLIKAGFPAIDDIKKLGDGYVPTVRTIRENWLGSIGKKSNTVKRSNTVKTSDAVRENI